ncbi:hypothetical protein SORDD16_00848 [Streptococcus oralis]|uniref:Uncharacterized protein n=1 Tax=Streptococcus oralis TaxID=1303 RepID=A0A139PE80_STROR|nr:hypothetical protein [Streptococcus oralis]KXT87214.1 hypothetical protein SORDD16_00848 [Streptococcus oralis]
MIFNGIGRSNCVCGNAIKYAYELFNGVTGQRLFPVGSGWLVRHLMKKYGFLVSLAKLSKK